MRRTVAILLIGLFLVLGSGVLAFAHNLQHRHEDSDAPAPAGQHDESNCFLHAKLHSPIAAGEWVPLLVCLGVFVAFLTLLPQRPFTSRHLLRCDCRGPPALLLSV